jgi:hypothetical protein
MTDEGVSDPTSLLPTLGDVGVDHKPDVDAVLQSGEHIVRETENEGTPEESKREKEEESN